MFPQTNPTIIIIGTLEIPKPEEVIRGVMSNCVIIAEQHFILQVDQPPSDEAIVNAFRTGVIRPEEFNSDNIFRGSTTIRRTASFHCEVFTRHRILPRLPSVITTEVITHSVLIPVEGVLQLDAVRDTSFPVEIKLHSIF